MQLRYTVLPDVVPVTLIAACAIKHRMEQTSGYLNCTGRAGSLYSLVVKQVEAAVPVRSSCHLCLHDVPDLLHKPGFVLDDQGHSGGLNKVVCHAYVAFTAFCLIPCELQVRLTPCKWKGYREVAAHKQQIA